MDWGLGCCPEHNCKHLIGAFSKHDDCNETRTSVYVEVSQPKFEGCRIARVVAQNSNTVKFFSLLPNLQCITSALRERFVGSLSFWLQNVAQGLFRDSSGALFGLSLEAPNLQPSSSSSSSSGSSSSSSSSSAPPGMQLRLNVHVELCCVHVELHVHVFFLEARAERPLSSL